MALNGRLPRSLDARFARAFTSSTERPSRPTLYTAVAMPPDKSPTPNFALIPSLSLTDYHQSPNIFSSFLFSTRRQKD